MLFRVFRDYVNRSKRVTESGDSPKCLEQASKLVHIVACVNYFSFNSTARVVREIKKWERVGSRHESRKQPV